MKIKFKAYQALADGEKLPRKLKKALLGKRASKSKLRRMLAETRVVRHAKTMYENPDIEPYGMFCPECGYSLMKGTGNMTGHPEHWEHFYCMRCRNLVAVIDNSPFVHVLEFGDENYEIP